MTNYLIPLCAILIAYLLGSISSAVISCKLLGLPDPRTQGSGNPGATNVLRIGGKKAAILTLAGDILKGVIAVWLAKLYGFDVNVLALVTCAVFLGHVYPIFFGFQGGKGVATAFGCLITLAWPVGLALAATWFIVALVTRYSSLAALVSAVLGPLYAWYFTNPAYTLAAIFISLLLIWRHQNNIKKLLNHTESKIGAKKS